MSNLRYDPTVTLGHLLQAVVLTVGFVGGYINIKTTINRHDVQIISMVKTVESMSSTQAAMSLTQAELSQNLRVLTAIVNERTHPSQQRP
jgi:hypothetical protein